MRVKVGTIEINVYSNKPDPRLLERGARVLRKLRAISKALEPLAHEAPPVRRGEATRGEDMANSQKFQDFDSLLTGMDTVTNTIASQVAKAAANEQKQIDEIQRLKDQVANGGVVTEAEFDGLLARATAQRDRMNTIEANLRPLAVDPTDPIPDPAVPGDEEPEGGDPEPE